MPKAGHAFHLVGFARDKKMRLPRMLEAAMEPATARHFCMCTDLVQS